MSEYGNCVEHVPIKVNRVFDSCSDKECLTDVKVALECGELPENITLVKTRCIKVADVCMNVEPVPFNKGFYSIDITFKFKVELLAYESACCEPITLYGTAYASKNCILYGSETNSQTFFDNGMKIGSVNDCCKSVNMPTASVQVVSPIALSSKIENVFCDSAEKNKGCCKKPAVIMTIGLFYVVELTRPVTVMVPTYEYTIPEKECCTQIDSPCEMFNRIRFPKEEFSPIKLDNSDNEHPDCANPCCGCGD